MVRWGMVIDLDKCVACQACVVACMTENNVPISTREREAEWRSIRWLEMLTHAEEEHPKPKINLIPRPCFQCWNPPCVRVCPVRATYRDTQGLVAQIYARCIGCRMCTVACPYASRYFNWEKPKWPDEMKPMLNPNVAVRPKGVVERCTFCHQRLQLARKQARLEDRELRPEGDYVPACVEACPAKAMYFGDIDDPTTTVHKLSRSRRAFVIFEELGTEPKVFYLAEEE
ncbi:MAG: 4Fe-4S dicluster domain-containing protein [Candidatus Hydrothermarchaeaceae archaeon]